MSEHFIVTPNVMVCSTAGHRNVATEGNVRERGRSALADIGAINDAELLRLIVTSFQLWCKTYRWYPVSEVHGFEYLHGSGEPSSSIS